MPRRRLAPIGALLALSALAAGCESALEPGNDGQLSLSFEVPASQRAVRSEGARFSVSAAAPALEVKAVDLVLARVKLHHAGADDDDCEKGARCESFKTGPVLVSLPIGGGKVTPFATLPPAGSYDALAFHIHKPLGEDSTTREFRTRNPTWPTSAAIRVSGTYDGKPFESYFRTEARIRQRFEQPLVIDAATKAADLGLTVSVDVSKWFVDVNGAVINPAELTSNHRLLAQVEKNIRESFRTRHGKGERHDDDRGNKGKGGDRGKGKKD